ncbi:phage baseplate assembly protein V [Geodermatophilus sp. SYSU D00742]
MTEGQPGVFVGIVEDLDDPDGLARVRVTLPHLDNQVSDWARLSVPMAGKDRGTFFRPQKGDEVLLACEHGDPRRLYVLGSLWNGQDKPPSGMGEPEDNAIRAIVTPRGQRIVLDDTPGAEKIQVLDSSGKQTVVIDGSTITVHADAGKVDVTASGDVSVSAGGDLTLHAARTVTITGTKVNIN